MPTFSVVLATRDRPALFAEALASVMAQNHSSFEIIVVNDGTHEQHLHNYQAIWDQASHSLGDRFRSYSLVHRPKGHGQSYSLNYGVYHARGDYVCFLDDDDKWTDSEHLTRASNAIDTAKETGNQIDLYMSNQNAWINEQQVAGSVWLEGLEAELTAKGKRPDRHGCFSVTVDDLMATTGFCHLNCLIVRRELFNLVGGMDEGIRWECDRDIFLKLIDHSSLMLHHPKVISYHRVPDPSKALNMTTTLGMIEKRLLQTRVLDRAALFAKNPLIRAHGRREKGFALKKIAQELAGTRDWVSAAYYAAQAAGAAPNPKWWMFTVYCWAKALINNERNDNRP